jgi:hypothetical protein
MWKEATVTYFKIRSVHMSGGNKQIKEDPYKYKRPLDRDPKPGHIENETDVMNAFYFIQNNTNL